jgi:hypothetical protein
MNMSRQDVLNDFSIKELMDELCKRTDVFDYNTQPDGMYSLHVMSTGHDHMATNCGSYRILVVKE